MYNYYQVFVNTTLANSYVTIVDIWGLTSTVDNGPTYNYASMFTNSLVTVRANAANVISGNKFSMTIYPLPWDEWDCGNLYYGAPMTYTVTVGVVQFLPSLCGTIGDKYSIIPMYSWENLEFVRL